MTKVKEYKKGQGSDSITVVFKVKLYNSLQMYNIQLQL
jgi:hypothetical protein